MQAIGGTIWHGIKGFRNSPYGERRIGAITAIKARAPVLGGNFGVWGGLFSTFDCAVKGVRRKEDPWNAIIAGFFTGGSLAIRGGYKAARNGAIGCAVLLAVIEGVGIGFQRMLAGSTKLEVRISTNNSHRTLRSTLPWLSSSLYENHITNRLFHTGPAASAQQRDGPRLDFSLKVNSKHFPRHSTLLRRARLFVFDLSVNTLIIIGRV